MLHTLIEPSDFVLKIIGGIHELEGNLQSIRYHTHNLLEEMKDIEEWVVLELKLGPRILPVMGCICSFSFFFKFIVHSRRELFGAWSMAYLPVIAVLLRDSIETVLHMQL